VSIKSNLGEINLGEFNLGDQSVATTALTIIITDSFTLSDSISFVRDNEYIIEITDSHELSDSVSWSEILSRNISDTLSLSDLLGVKLDPHSLLLSFFTIGVGGVLSVAKTSDGLNFDFLDVVDPPVVRDPSIIKIGAYYYAACTGNETDSFVIYRSLDLLNWELHTTVILGNVYGGVPVLCWAPTWFIDPTYNTVHIIVNASSEAWKGRMHPYEIHPTDPEDLTSSWTNPIRLIEDTGGCYYDATIYKIGSEYRIVYKEHNFTIQPVIRWAKSTTLTDYYTDSVVILSSTYFDQKYESPSMLFLGNNWRCYVDDYKNSWTEGDVYYIENDDGNDWLSWSDPVLLIEDLKHPQVFAGEYQFTGYEDSIAESLDNWQDDILLDVDYLSFVSISESMYHFYDDVICYLAAWHVPLTVEISDSLNSFEDQLDSVEYVQLGADITLEIGDILYLTDTNIVKCDIALLVEDDLNEWQDEVAVMPGEFVDYAYDTMMYDFLDAIELDFRLHRGVSDTMTLSDAISTSLAAYLQTASISDNAANLNDAINLRVSGFKAVSDSLALYDFIKLSMFQALSLADTLSMSDAVSVQLSVTDASLEDSLDLWNDLVSASLSAKIDQSVSDSMSQSDTVSTETELGEDLRYYRRYLNDVSA